MDKLKNRDHVVEIDLLNKILICYERYIYKRHKKTIYK